MISPYNNAREIFHSVENSFTCEPNLGLDRLEMTGNTGASASGMQFAIGEKNGFDMFIKFFSMPCQLKKVTLPNGRIRKTKMDVDDYNLTEIGLTKIMSNVLLMEPVPTQNLVFVYGTSFCPNAFGVTNSKCTLEDIPLHTHTLIPESGYPQCNFRSDYNNGNLDDQINTMVVELCNGDLQILFNHSANELSLNPSQNDVNNFNDMWNSIMMQICITTMILDNIFKPYFHNDSGLRNFLYSRHDHGDNCCDVQKSRYFSYTVNGKEYKIKDMGYVPKLWDYSYMHISENMKQRFKNMEEFSYIDDKDKIKSVREDCFPCIKQICESFISMPSFYKIKDTDFGKRIRIIATHTDRIEDYNDILDHFDVYDKTKNNELEEVLTEPKFHYDFVI